MHQKRNMPHKFKQIQDLRFNISYNALHRTFIKPMNFWTFKQVVMIIGLHIYLLSCLLLTKMERKMMMLSVHLAPAAPIRVLDEGVFVTMDSMAKAWKFSRGTHRGKKKCD